MLSGSRLGSYELLSPLGAGGMGEVYRARDLKLGREVAIKVLPEAFAADPVRLARFAREAQLLASLNHPNIAAIYGLEDSDRGKALILELVTGETLAERIARGPTSLEEVLPIAKQVVAAVEAAHEQGIIHRDLKPANIKITPDGVVKVLDFGLAKLAGAATAVTSSSHLSLSPTVTSPALMTGVGVLLGTAAYMAPEQAKGREADKRSDVWAIGCLLYEMLTGTRAFAGDDVAETLASVLKGEPDWSRLPGDVPAAIRIALRRCLAKDPTLRLAGLAGLSFVLSEYEALTPTRQPLPAAPVVRRSWGTAGLVMAVAILVASVAAWTTWRLKPTPEKPTRRLELALPDGASLIEANTRPLMAISADARYFAVVGSGGQLFLKTPDKPAFAASGAGGNVFNPVFSPDGQWVAFTQNGKLRKLSVAGGSSIDICESGAPPLGISWTERDTILFSRGPEGIWSVPAAGGVPVRIIAVDSKDQIAWGPQLLPGGTDVLFTLASNADANRAGGWDNGAILIESLATHQRQTVLNGGSDARYVSSGHILYTRQRTVFALPFDVSARKVLSAPVPVLQGVAGNGSGVTFGGQGGASQFAVSSNGTLIYAAQVEGSTDRTVVWIDRAGHEAPLPIPARAHTYPRLSPDGQRLALDIRDQKQDIWIWDLRRQVLTPLTFDPVAEIAPLWTPDGTHIIYLRTGKGLFSQAADGSGQAEPLTETPFESLTPTGFTLDGRWLLLSTQTASGFDILRLDLTTKMLSPLIADPTNQEQNAALSPDGKWIAYQSDETGQTEIYVRPYPTVSGGTSKVSSNGATRPLWSADGRELFFMGGGVNNSAGSPLMVAPVVTTSPTFEAGPVRQLLPGPFFSGLANRTYDVTKDGQHFIVIKSNGPGTATGRVVLVDNWFQELQRLAPSPK